MKWPWSKPEKEYGEPYEDELVKEFTRKTVVFGFVRGDEKEFTFDDSHLKKYTSEPNQRELVKYTGGTVGKRHGEYGIYVQGEIYRGGKKMRDDEELVATLYPHNLEYEEVVEEKEMMMSIYCMFKPIFRGDERVGKTIVWDSIPADGPLIMEK